MLIGNNLCLFLLATISSLKYNAVAFKNSNRSSLSLMTKAEPNSTIDIYDVMLKGIPALQRYATDLFHEAASHYKDLPSRIDGIHSQLLQTSQSVADLRMELEQLSNTKRSKIFEDELTSLSHKRTPDVNVIPGDVLHEIELAFQMIFEDFHDSLPSTDEAPFHNQLETLVNRLLQKAKNVLIEIFCMKYHVIDESSFRKFWDEFSPKMQDIIVTTCDFAEQHPELVELIVIAVVFMVIPESWLFRPLLSLVGFGPYGPIRGSSAAWIQRFMFGAEVPRASWFSHLQSAGMKYGSADFKKIVAGLGAATGIAVAGTVRRCCRPRR